MGIGKNGVPCKYIDIVQDIFKGVKTNAMTCGAMQDFFLFFIFYMMRYHGAFSVDNIVLMDETKN